MSPDALKLLLEANERYRHREHQLEGVQKLLEHPFFFLGDEVGCGKTKTVIDAAHVLFLGKTIDTCAVFTPGFARSTWADPDPLLGEIAKHGWARVNNVVHEWHGREARQFDFKPTNALHWVISNYEFIRREARLQEVLRLLLGRRVLLVLDEAWALKGRSDQMKACRKIRYNRAERVVELNGTPLSDGKPLDLFYPFMILDPNIIGVSNITHFKAKYCLMGGFKGKQVVAYHDLDELNKRIAPYVRAKRTRECWDLPPMLDPITIEVPLEDETWKLYREMRDEMVAWFGTQASVSKQAITRILRLAQITSGYLGGLTETLDNPAANVNDDASMPDWLRALKGLPRSPASQVPLPLASAPMPAATGPLTREIGSEKLNGMINWLHTLTPTPRKIIIWCRFRLELERATKTLEKEFPGLTVHNLRGGQSPEDREKAKRSLAPPPNGLFEWVVGNQKAGGASLNLAAATMAIYLSNGPALIERTQSIGRIERPGAVEPMCVVDIVATGPRGQKTIDHQTIKSLRAKHDMAQFTVSEWRRILAEE